MARAQTYIIAKDNNVYSYSGELHDDNHNMHMSKNYKNLKINEFIPFILSKNGNVVIDLIRHSTNGNIYLPLEPTDFQKNGLSIEVEHSIKLIGNYVKLAMIRIIFMIMLNLKK